MNVASGIFFYSKNTKRFLYLLRNDPSNYTWSIPGGKIEKNETLFEGLERECIEELNFNISNLKLIPIQKFTNNTFTYNTFFCMIEEEFTPELNDEHIGYAWVGEEQYPRPLHPGLFSTVNIDLVREKLTFLTKT